MNPRKNGILRDIIVIPACNLIEPLQILIIGHKLVNPMHWLLRVYVIGKRVLLDLDKGLKDGKEGVNIAEIEVKHHFLAILCLDVDCVVGGIESFFVDLLDV